jgi:hypothetical protein
VKDLNAGALTERDKVEVDIGGGSASRKQEFELVL